MTQQSDTGYSYLSSVTSSVMLHNPPSSHFLYFSYGSNLNTNRIHINCPLAQPLAVARLPRHKFAYTLYSDRWKGGVADILEDEGHEVWGIIWAIPLDHLPALDAQEGVEVQQYRRSEVAVHPQSNPSETITCISYKVCSPNLKGVAPSPKYKRTILDGARESHGLGTSLPANYISSVIESIMDSEESQLASKQAGL